MRIALVIEQFDPTGGGAERSSGQIVAGLRERGHEVAVLTGRGDGDGVRCCPSGPPRRGLTIPPFVRWASAQLRSGAFDVSLSVVTWLPADVLQPRSGVIAEAQERSLVRKRGLGRMAKRLEYLLFPKHRLMRGLERRQLAGTGVRRVIAISRYMQEQLIRHYGVDEARIVLIPNGAEMPEPDPAWRGQVRRRLGIGETATVYLFLANDPWRKGLKPLLHAFGRLLGECVLLIAGVERPGVRRMVERLGLTERVRLAGETKSAAELYCASDVTVLPSYYDPASKVVIESLMCGTPAITTLFNGSCDFLDGGRGRVIEDPDDTGALAGAMAELADPEQRRRCRDALKGIGNQLSMRRHVEQLEALLDEVAREKRTS